MIAEAQAEAVRVVGAAIGTAEGLSAANLKVAELYVAAFKELAKTNNTLIIPSNLNDAAEFCGECDDGAGQGEVGGRGAEEGVTVVTVVKAGLRT